jgi:hypothetical protein
MMRQIAGSFAEYEKRRLVRKLRDRKKAETGSAVVGTPMSSAKAAKS